MNKRLPFITQEKRKGVGKLLVWCIQRFNKSTSHIRKQMWYERKEFLAELQRKQTYTEEDKEEYNKIRYEYFKSKKDE